MQTKPVFMIYLPIVTVDMSLNNHIKLKFSMNNLSPFYILTISALTCESAPRLFGLSIELKAQKFAIEIRHIAIIIRFGVKRPIRR